MAPNLIQLLPKFTARRREADGRAQRKRRTSVTALDLEGGWLQVVQAAIRGGQARVVRHATAALELAPGANPEDPAVLGAAVAAALSRLRVSPGPVVMGVPRAQVMLRNLELPPAQRPAEVAAMVHFQVSRDLPFRLEEALLDFKVLAATDDAGPSATQPAAEGSGPDAKSAGATQVLAAVARRETVDHYVALARAAGLKLVSLGLRSLASARAIEFCHREVAGGCVALVSVRGAEVVFDVLHDRALVYSRVGTLPATLEAPAGAAANDTTAIESTVLEVVRSLHSYENAEGHSHVARIFVAGATGAETKIAEALSQRFAVPAQVVEPGAALRDAEGEKAQLATALPAIGLALGALDPDGFPFDFLNPKRPPVPRDLRRVRRLGLAAAALAALLSVAGLRSHWLRQREAQRAEVQQQVSLATKNLGAYRLVRAQARALKDWETGGHNWLDHLALLSSLLPPSEELYLTSIATGGRNTLTLAAKVRRGEIVDRLSATLRAAGYDVKPPAISPAGDRFGYPFQANLEITVPAKLTNDLDHLEVESRPPPHRPSERRASPPEATAPPAPPSSAPASPAAPAAAPAPATPAPAEIAPAAASAKSRASNAERPRRGRRGPWPGGRRPQ